MLQQVSRMPGKLIWAVANKIVSAAARPDLMQLFFINIVHPQQRQRLQLMVAHTFAHIRRVLHATAKLFFGSEIEFAQQTLFPAIPQGFIGGAMSATVRQTRKRRRFSGLHHFGRTV
jgi:hypothetical protein